MDSRAAELEARTGDLLRYAVVDSVDLDAATVLVRAGDKVLGPMPWFMPRSGADVVWSPPSADEQGLLLCPEGDTATAVFLPGVRSSKHPFPAGDERALVARFRDGAEVAYDPQAHALTAVMPAGGTVSVTAAGGITLIGPVEVQGPLHATQAISSDIDCLSDGVSGKSHVHDGVRSGTSNTGQPVH